MTFGHRAAQAAIDVLTPGPIGAYWRRDVARDFQACGEHIDLSTVHTTCGVFASACWFHGGRPLHHTRASRLGGALVGVPSWIDAPHECFVEAGHHTPGVGDVLCHGASLATTHHVELVIAVHDDGTVTTAHGGDSPTTAELVAAGIVNDPKACDAARGTVARLGTGPKTLVGVCGWYSARLVAEAEHLDDVKDLGERDTDPGGHVIDNADKPMGGV